VTGQKRRRPLVDGRAGDISKAQHSSLRRDIVARQEAGRQLSLIPDDQPDACKPFLPYAGATVDVRPRRRRRAKR
jgi:hypothetical protein